MKPAGINRYAVESGSDLDKQLTDSMKSGVPIESGGERFRVLSREERSRWPRSHAFFECERLPDTRVVNTIIVDSGSWLDEVMLQAARQGEHVTVLDVKYDIVGYNTVTVGEGPSHYYLRRAS